MQYKKKFYLIFLLGFSISLISKQEEFGPDISDIVLPEYDIKEDTNSIEILTLPNNDYYPEFESTPTKKLSTIPEIKTDKAGTSPEIETNEASALPEGRTNETGTSPEIEIDENFDFDDNLDEDDDFGDFDEE